MATVTEFYQAIDRLAPFQTQMSFDNAGFLVGRGEAEVSRVLVALDITLPVIQEAKMLGAQLIISHHPVIFDPVRSIVAGDPTGDKLIALIRANLSAICAHTNLDIAEGGVNDALARAVGLKDIEIFLPDGLGRIGYTECALKLPEFARQVKCALGANGVRYVDTGRPVQKVAVGGGSCGSSLRDAYEMGCDAFVTADIKYDVFLDAKALGIGLIDAGHYPTEQVICPVLADYLRKTFPEAEIFLSAVHKEPFSYG